YACHPAWRRRRPSDPKLCSTRKPWTSSVRWVEGAAEKAVPRAVPKVVRRGGKAYRLRSVVRSLAGPSWLGGGKGGANIGSGGPARARGRPFRRVPNGRPARGRPLPRRSHGSVLRDERRAWAGGSARGPRGAGGRPGGGGAGAKGVGPPPAPRST